MYESSKPPHVSPASITVHFPLLLEDPFAEDRRDGVFADLLLGMSSPESASNSILLPPQPLYERGPPPTLASCHSLSRETQLPSRSVLSMDRHGSSNVHKLGWREAVEEGMQFKSLVLPEVRDYHHLVGRRQLLLLGRGRTVVI